MSEVRWSPEVIDRSAKGIADVQEDAAATQSSLDGTIAELGECWGVKKVGQTFAGVYVEPATKVQEAVGAIAAFYGGFADQLTQAARAYAATEEANTV